MYFGNKKSTRKQKKSMCNNNTQNEARTKRIYQKKPVLKHKNNEHSMRMYGKY